MCLVQIIIIIIPHLIRPGQQQPLPNATNSQTPSSAPYQAPVSQAYAPPGQPYPTNNYPPHGYHQQQGYPMPGPQSAQYPPAQGYPGQYGQRPQSNQMQPPPGPGYGAYGYQPPQQQ